MKAAVFREYNKDPTQVVKIEDIDVPNIKPNEVMIKVESAAYTQSRLHFHTFQEATLVVR